MALAFFAYALLRLGAVWLGHALIHKWTHGMATADDGAVSVMMAALAYSVAISLVFAYIDDAFESANETDEPASKASVLTNGFLAEVNLASADL
jgi:hypothetical protein